MRTLQAMGTCGHAHEQETHDAWQAEPVEGYDDHNRKGQYDDDFA
jgi:hypothetical protein